MLEKILLIAVTLVIITFMESRLLTKRTMITVIPISFMNLVSLCTGLYVFDQLNLPNIFGYFTMTNIIAVLSCIWFLSDCQYEIDNKLRAIFNLSMTTILSVIFANAAAYIIIGLGSSSLFSVVFQMTIFSTLFTVFVALAIKILQSLFELYDLIK